ncbi:MAG TPA: beta-1,6-N-acetylglucosaminyltransferase [Bryobacteraceae bacterium]|nr:beta-1,6-N-acetylglucosaminyltransferase [Bryobacteraceae bacterium]
MRLGFVILSHANPDQVLRLAKRLADTFAPAAIACHHDTNKSAIDAKRLPAFCTLVKNAVNTSWGRFSVVEAELRALQLLYDKYDPDWFVMLSGADYPVQRASVVSAELSQGGYDAYVDFRKISFANRSEQRFLTGLDLGGDGGFDRPEWKRIAFDRYVAIRLRYEPRGRNQSRRYLVRHLVVVRLASRFKFCRNIYAGDHWFSGNRKVARHLLSDTPLTKQMLAHFRSRPIPEEGIYQSIICNVPGLKLCADNKRYADWTAGGLHPKLLGPGDIPLIVKSGAHFARKFAADSPALGRLDALLREDQ